jgi:deoxycytidylate deaminase
MNYYAKDCELILALVCPVGVSLDDVQSRLLSIFQQFNYEVKNVHLSELLNEHLSSGYEPYQDEVARLDEAMKKGNEFRRKFNRGDMLALLAIAAINSKRVPKIGPLKRTVHIIRSLKHADEVETLRQVYGAGFFLLGVSASMEARSHYLKELKGVSEDQIDRLIQRDDKEGDVYGQQTRDVFQLADAFITTDDTERLSTQIGRIIDVLFSKPVVPPTSEEYAMFMAYAASLRSADLSRQVGAVLVSESQDIVSTGANDVPKFSGGLYWAGEKDQRDYIRGYDSNELERGRIAQDITEKLIDSGVCESDKEKIFKVINETRITDLTEYGRAVHAEMEAIMQAARNGISVRNGTLYVTTYPCHNCAKHIVAAGIKKVIYIEPYPKSYALKLHDDSIGGEDAEEKVQFKQFVGIGPRRFIDLFSMRLSSGRKLKRKERGEVTKWSRSVAELRVPMTPLSYMDSEIKLVKELGDILRGD